jgi:hypothetical protein
MLSEKPQNYEAAKCWSPVIFIESNWLMNSVLHTKSLVKKGRADPLSRQNGHRTARLYFF